MSTDLSRQLSEWLNATDIDLLELRGPGVHLRVLNEARRAATAPVSAPSVGVFLHRHPLHDVPLAATGQPITAGQVIGLLRIGPLLLPVVAPQNGIMVAHRVAHGTAVGYGTDLIDVIPSTPA